MGLFYNPERDNQMGDKKKKKPQNKWKRKVILKSLLMSQHKVRVTFSVIINYKRKYFYKQHVPKW